MTRSGPSVAADAPKHVVTPTLRAPKYAYRSVSVLMTPPYYTKVTVSPRQSAPCVPVTRCGMIAAGAARRHVMTPSLCAQSSAYRSVSVLVPTYSTKVAVSLRHSAPNNVTLVSMKIKSTAGAVVWRPVNTPPLPAQCVEVCQCDASMDWGHATKCGMCPLTTPILHEGNCIAETECPPCLAACPLGSEDGEIPEGKRCPSCVPCKHHGVMYEIGQTWMLGHKVECECFRTDENEKIAVCTKMDEMPCAPCGEEQREVRVEGTRCPDCEDCETSRSCPDLPDDCDEYRTYQAPDECCPRCLEQCEDSAGTVHSPLTDGPGWLINPDDICSKRCRCNPDGFSECYDLCDGCPEHEKYPTHGECCQCTACELPEDIDNGRAVDTRWRDDMVHVVYQCNPGYWFPDGNNRGSCVEGGTVLPECILKQNLAVGLHEYDGNALFICSLSIVRVHANIMLVSACFSDR